MEISDIFAEVGRLHLEVSELNKLVTELRAELEKSKVQKMDNPPKE